MKWGVFETKFDSQEPVMVAPVTDDEVLQDGHVLSVDCPCKPEFKEGRVLVHKNLVN